MMTFKLTITTQEQDFVIMVDILMKNHLNAHHNGKAN